MEQMTAQEALESAKGITFEKAWAIMQDDWRKREAERKVEMAEFKKNLEKAVGNLSNSIGELTEALFSGSLHTRFKEYGYVFDSQCPDKMFFDENGEGICEADIWLENGDYVMAVEIKTHPKNADINEHIERIGKIRKYMDKKNDKRKIIGAIAGGVFKSEVRRYAHGKGLHVIVQSGESIEIAKPPKGFKAREWEMA